MRLHCSFFWQASRWPPSRAVRPPLNPVTASEASPSIARRRRTKDTIAARSVRGLVAPGLTRPLACKAGSFLRADLKLETAISSARCYCRRGRTSSRTRRAGRRCAPELGIRDFGSGRPPQSGGPHEDHPMKFASLMLAAALALGAGEACAHGYKLGSLEIAHPWSRATPKGASVGAGYLKITNSGTAPDRLMGGTVAVAKRFEVHEMKTENGVAKMRPVVGGLEIKPGATVELGPD